MHLISSSSMLVSMSLVYKCVGRLLQQRVWVFREGRFIIVQVRRPVVLAKKQTALLAI
jgi:hypothetical protein